MTPDLEEIADRLARAKQFCATVPRGDFRTVPERALVNHIESLCDELVPGELRFLSTPGISQEMREGSIARLYWMLGKVDELVRHAQQFPLAKEIGRRAQRSRQGQQKTLEIRQRDATKAKDEEERVAKEILDKHPGYSARRVAIKVQAQLNRKSADTVYRHIKAFVDSYKKSLKSQ